MTTAAMPTNMKWNDEGPSFRFDVLGFVLALALHTPLFFMKFNEHKKSIDTPRERLVSIDMVGPEIFKKEEAPPPPVAPVVKENSLMERLKALVHKEPPPPPAPKKEEAPKQLDLGPKQIDLKSQMSQLPQVAPKIESKTGFKTDMDPKLAEEKKLAMNAGGPALAPLTASKVGTLSPKSTINSKSGFQISKTESLSSISGSGPKMADAAAPAIAIRSGSTGSKEQYSAAPVQKADKGRLGDVAGGSLNDSSMSLRDKMIMRDAAPSAINTGGSGSRIAGAGTGSGVASGKKDAGRFTDAGVAGGVAGGVPGGKLGGTGTAINTAGSAVITQVPKKRQEKSLFVIQGDLKDRKIVHQQIPEYPEWAQSQGIEASVVLEFTVKPDGSVKPIIAVRRTSGYPKLDESAIQALRQWKFVPLADENREEVGLITFNYSLS